MNSKLPDKKRRTKSSNLAHSSSVSKLFISSDRSSYSDDGPLHIQQRPLFEIFTHSIDSIDVTSVTLSRLNSINAIDVTRC